MHENKTAAYFDCIVNNNKPLALISRYTAYELSTITSTFVQCEFGTSFNIISNVCFLKIQHHISQCFFSVLLFKLYLFLFFPVSYSVSNQSPHLPYRRKLSFSPQPQDIQLGFKVQLLPLLTWTQYPIAIYFFNLDFCPFTCPRHSYSQPQKFHLKNFLFFFCPCLIIVSFQLRLVLHSIFAITVSGGNRKNTKKERRKGEKATSETFHCQLSGTISETLYF